MVAAAALLLILLISCICSCHPSITMHEISTQYELLSHASMSSSNPVELMEQHGDA